MTTRLNQHIISNLANNEYRIDYHEGQTWVLKLQVLKINEIMTEMSKVATA